MLKDNVIVLLSTFNGERYLKEQLSSLFLQENVDVSILVRDDGSTDNTCTILDSEKCNLSWYKGENKGPAFSFWELLCKAPESSYYSFCDQDDVWDKDKLETAISFLSKSNGKPALYFCQTRLVDSELKDIGTLELSPLLTFEEALIYHFVTGCTMVINDALRRILIEYTPKYMRMHDLWIYLVAQAIDADIYFDKKSHIAYRQHDNNVIGMNNSALFNLKKRIKRILKNECIRYRLAKELLNGYEKRIPLNKLKELKLITNYKNGIIPWFRLLFTKKFKCGSLSINISSKLAIFLRAL